MIVAALLMLVALILASADGALWRRGSVIRAVLLWYLSMLVGAIALTVCHQAHAVDVTAAARPWQRTVIRESHAVWGLSAPVSVMAAQIHQESGWRPSASSLYAEGMAQFTATTARDMARWYPELGPADPYNPVWSIRALVRYDDRLYAPLVDTATVCDRWAMTLSAYNGGAGWLARDRARCRSVSGCDPARWWDHVAGQTQRAAWAQKENRAYPERILHQWQPRYVAAGWPGEPACP